MKSLRLAFALDWVIDQWSPVVVVCRRHPLDVVASAVEMGFEHRLDWIAPKARTYGKERQLLELIGFGRVMNAVAVYRWGRNGAARAGPEIETPDPVAA